jgi:hypothetical protein
MDMAVNTLFYQVNPDSIIFLDVDKGNGYTTIAQNWETDDIFLIKPMEYKILKFIHDNQSVSQDSLLEYLQTDEERTALKTILDIFVQKKLLLTHE